MFVCKRPGHSQIAQKSTFKGTQVHFARRCRNASQSQQHRSCSMTCFHLRLQPLPHCEMNNNQKGNQFCAQLCHPYASIGHASVSLQDFVCADQEFKVKTQSVEPMLQLDRTVFCAHELKTLGQHCWQARLALARNAV